MNQTAPQRDAFLTRRDMLVRTAAGLAGTALFPAAAAFGQAVAGRLNNAFRRLGSGWAIFVEAQRHGAGAYPTSRFPEAASADDGASSTG